MKRLFLMLIVSLIISPVVEAASVRSYYFPGDVGSLWSYSLPQNLNSTFVHTGQEKIDGHSYTVITETLPILGPAFTTFREAGNTIWGHGQVANTAIANNLINEFNKVGLQADLKPHAREWVVLKNVDLGSHWIVSSFSLTIWDPVQPDRKLPGFLKIEAEVIRNDEKIVIGARSFDAVAVQYSLWREMLDLKRKDLMMTLWFAEGVGIVRLLNGQGLAQITRYELNPLSVSPQGKISTTWGELKIR